MVTGVIVIAANLLADHLLHSTSWRHEAASRLVLTYDYCPDPRSDLPATPLRSRSLARAAGPADPSPAGTTSDHVAAHAIRHLAFLSDTDPTARPVIEAIPGLTDLLENQAPATAGQLPQAADDTDHPATTVGDRPLRSTARTSPPYRTPSRRDNRGPTRRCPPSADQGSGPRARRSCVRCRRRAPATPGRMRAARS